MSHKYVQGLHALTIAPSDKYQYFRSPLRMIRCKEYMHKKLSYLHEVHGMEYYFHMEISEPLDNDNGCIGPRVHAHGFIHLANKKQIKSFLLTGWTHLADDCKIMIKPIDDTAGWSDYITKQCDMVNESPLTNFVDGKLTSYLEGKAEPDSTALLDPEDRGKRGGKKKPKVSSTLAKKKPKASSSCTSTNK